MGYQGGPLVVVTIWWSRNKVAVGELVARLTPFLDNNNSYKNNQNNK